MTVLVTGGRGLVGSHVIEALRAAGEDVRSFEGDVTDLAAWRKATAARVTGIVHAAARVAQRLPFAEFERVNVGGTRLAVATARATGARLIHVSSVAVFGRTAAFAAGAGAVDEDFSFGPIPEHDFYARTKRMAETVVQESGLSAATIRPNVIYGERDKLFTARVIKVLRSGIMPRIGPGTNHLSCVYVGNVAAAIVAALGKSIPGFRAYNITADAPPALTEREFMGAFADALGVRVWRIPIPVSVARVGAGLWARWLQLRDPVGYAGLGAAAVGFIVGENPYTAARAQQELGWTPPFDTRTGIRRSVAAF
jgi:nucleoside-diphosphate-sugar epimerase